MRVRTIAPAKINWTLEVLGKRPDGYHEVRTVLQTVDLCDEVEVRKKEGGRRKEGASGSVIEAGAATLVVEGNHEAREDDLTLRAVRVLEEMTGHELPVEIRLVKRIPAGAGLGGGSSDAAAVLRCVDELWRGRYSESQGLRAARLLGSDVSFFLRGGTTSVAGRGDEIKAVMYSPGMWLVLLVPPMRLPDKTATMYASLDERDFSDGARTIALVRRVRWLDLPRQSLPGGAARGDRPIEDEQLFNAFTRIAYQEFEGLDRYREELLRAGATAVHLAGSGPALFVLAGSEENAREMAGRVDPMGGQVFVARTLSLWGATRVDVE